MASDGSILVTGGSGYLAGWTIAALLERGFDVRTTLRRLDRADAIRRRTGAPEGRLSVAAADLTSDAGWAEAMAGVSTVIHMATPMQAKGPELLAASREGTQRVLRAAEAAGVRRIVVTSSGYAALPPPAPRGTIERTDETVWTDPEAPGLGDYARAKTLAERDAWAFAAGHPQIELATVLPGFILGPLQSADISPSMQLIDMMLRGALPAIPDIGMSVVDVRDAADLHVRAATSPAAAGQRFLASSDFIWFRDIAALLRRELGSDGARAPTRHMPDWLVHALALVSPPLRELAPNLGRRRDLDHRKAVEMLGWAPRPVAETIIEGARSLLAPR